MDNTTLSASSSKWTEIEHLPEWDEEFYHVYTAKKHGKWLMLKTLRPELKGQEKFDRMIEKEFEVRYNLAHPHIIMINDFEEVPGLGMCIITDDVYGDSLAKLIREGKVTEDHLFKIQHQLLDALDYIQAKHLEHHPLSTSRIIFTENIGNLKLIDVGFDQKNRLEPTDVEEDIRAYGRVLSAALDACPENMPHLRAVADRCLSPFPYSNVQQLQMAVADRSAKWLYIMIIVFLAAAVAVLSAILAFRP